MKKLPIVDSQPRYSVASAVFETKTAEKTKHIILDDGIPSVDINKHLIIKQEKLARPVSTDAYNLCLFLNAIDAVGVNFQQVTMDMIYSYLSDEYVDRCKTFQTINSYISSIASLYESLARRHYSLDESLYRPDTRAILCSANQTKAKVLKSRKDRLTMVNSLRYEFFPRKSDAPQSSYTKWYSPDEIEAISEALQLGYRCIFLDTVFTGHRIDSALSMTIDSVNLRSRSVRPTRSKTGRIHTSQIPPKLAELMLLYQIEVRSQIVAKTGSTSDYLFLGRDGQPVTYGAFDKALKVACKQICNKNSRFNITTLHTHAGRSTFAATLRSYQLKQQRDGVPTFSDVDFCHLMDWSSLACLENYDLITRAQEVPEFLEKFFLEYMDIAQINRII